MENFNNFWNNYKGAIIGVIIAGLILITKAYYSIIAIIVIIIGAIIGNYIQQNKEIVKDKIMGFIEGIKGFIDRIL